MKKIIILATLALAIPLIVMRQSTVRSEVIRNEISTIRVPQNFTSLNWSADVDTIHGNLDCQNCHPQYNTGVSVALDTPLWNHQFTSVTYTNYSGTSPLAVAGIGCITPIPEVESRLCLYCHEGIVSLNVLGEPTDLNKHHPVSVDYNCSYNAGLANLRPISWVYNTSNDVAESTYVVKTIATLLDTDGKLQCTTCHRIHDSTNRFLLCMDNRGSFLCLVCHNY